MVQAIDYDLEKRLKPEIFPSQILSEKLGLDVCIMDFPHKRMKARDAIDYLEKARYDIGVAYTTGNYGLVLDREALDSPVQPVSLMMMEEPIRLTELGRGKYGVRIRLPRNLIDGKTKFLEAWQLERYWKRIVGNSSLSRLSKNIREIQDSSQYGRLVRLLEKNDLDYRNVKAVTNLCEWPNNDPYNVPEVYDALIHNDTVIIPNGSSELVLAFLKASRKIGRKSATIIACTSPANIFSYYYAFNRVIEDESEAPKLDMSKPSIASLEVRRLANKKIYFATIPRTPSLAGSSFYNAYAKQENSETNAGQTSGICIGALLYASDNDMELPNTYRFEHLDPWKDRRGLNIWEKYPVERTIRFKEGEKVCIVNTEDNIPSFFNHLNN